MRLFYLVDDYPHGSSEFFPHLEFPYLRQAFSEIVLVTRDPPDPSRPFAYPIPGGATVCVEIAQQTRAILLKKGALRREFLGTQPLGALGALRHHALRTWPGLLAAWTEANVFLDRLRARFSPNPEDVLYSFWLNPIVAVAAKRRIFGTVAARAHGYDLYWERWGGSPPPFQTLAMDSAVVFPCSLHGEAYLRAKYPGKRIRAEYLGVERRERLARSSDDGVFRIVTCANLIPLKRIDRLVSTLKRVKRACHWTHVGSGPMEAEIRNAAATLPQNVRAAFLGQIENDAVHRFYETEPVDLFLNLSTTEGISVALMEAMSHGIPCLATAVGGTPELLDGRDLLEADFTDEALALRIDGWTEPSLREAIRDRQRERFDARTNFTRFARELRALSDREKPFVR